MTRRATAVAALALSLSACTGKSNPTAPTPVAPTPPAAPACQTNRTGTVTFTNKGSKAVDIYWSGANFGTLTPGQTSAERTVAAGGPQYVFDSVLTNTNVHPCLTLTATPLQCTLTAYSTCNF